MIGQQGTGFGGARDRIGVEMADMERGTGRLTVYVQRLAAAFVNLRAADGVETDGVAVENARRAAAVFRLQRRAFKQVVAGDRKSTRLNSSHVAISYARFCF